MSSQEARAQFQRAEQLCQDGEYRQALRILDELREALPSSRRVVYQRALCLVNLERFDEALAACEVLDGKLDAKHIEALRSKIQRRRERAERARDAARGAVSSSGQAGEAAAAYAPAPGGGTEAGAEEVAAAAVAGMTQDAGEAGAGANVYQVESVFPLSTYQTTVTGRVVTGAFHTGDTVSLISTGGTPIFAPIIRIGPADTPIRVVRQGQQTVMVLQVEPQHLAPGSRLTSSGSAEAYAETMVVTGSEESGAAPGAGAPEHDADLDVVTRLLDERRFGPAKQRIESYLEKDPFSGTAYRLLARVHFESDDELHNNERALECIEKAYELGGDRDPAVLEELAKIQGANGRAEYGVRYLERLYAMAGDDEKREELAKRIESYRNRFKLGNVWEFINNWGDVIFESDNVDAIEKAIANGSVPVDAKCRRNRTGEWRTIQEILVPEHPQLARFFRRPAHYLIRGTVMGGVIGLAVGVIGAAIVFGSMAGNWESILGTWAVATLTGIGVGAGVGSFLERRQKTPAKKAAS